MLPSSKVFIKRMDRLLREAESKWMEKHRWERQCSTLIESIPSGWLNIVLTSVWPSLLERFFSNLATERLERSFQKRITNQRKKFPWKHLARVDVEHVTLGLSPPQFQVILAKYDPDKQALKLEADLKWTTSAFQIVLCPVIDSPMLQNLKTRFLLSNLDISGRICATLYLCQEQPGIKSCEISFCQVPSIDMRITPIGMALKDFPGIPESLRSTIVKSLTKEMVHPKKLTINLRKIYDTLRMKRRGGDGGLLTVTLSSASGFYGSEANSNVEVFCECEFEKLIFRTPIRRGAQSVVWDWNCAIRLDQKLTEMSDQPLTIRIFNAKSLGEPNLLAHGTIPLSEIVGLESGEGAVSKSMTLEGTSPGNQALMHLVCQWTPPTYTESPQRRNFDGDPVLRASSSAPVTATVQSDMTHELCDSKVELIQEALAQCCKPTTSTEALVVPPGSSSSESLPEECLQESLLDSSADINTVSDASCSSNEQQQNAPIDPDLPSIDCTEAKQATGFMSLLHVTKFDDALRRDRVLYKQRLAKMQLQVSELERKLAHEHQRRIDEGLQSMTEGARFIFHKHHEQVLRHLWYDPTSNSLNWASQKLPLHENATQTWQIKTQPLHQICEIRTGSDCFPKSALFGLWGLRSLIQRKLKIRQITDGSPTLEDNCLSILFANNKALNLEIPQGGNGRSRDAWVEALQALINQTTSPAKADRID